MKKKSKLAKVKFKNNLNPYHLNINQSQDIVI